MNEARNVESIATVNYLKGVVEEAVALFKQRQYKKIITLITSPRVNEAVSCLGFQFSQNGNSDYIVRGDPKKHLDFSTSQIHVQRAAVLVIEKLTETLHQLKGADLSDKSNVLGDLHEWTDVGAYLTDLGMEIPATMPYAEVTAVEGFKRVMERYAFTRRAIQAVYSSTDFSVLSSVGASGMVYVADSTPDEVYKVGVNQVGNTHRPAYFDEEVEKIKALQSSGVSPRLVEYKKTDLGEPRTILVPIIRMERVDFDRGYLAKVPENIRRKQGQRIKRILRQKRLVPRDVHFVWDKRNEKVRIIDLGGMHPLPEGELLTEIDEGVDSHLFRPSAY